LISTRFACVCLSVAFIERALEVHGDPTPERARLLTRLGEFVWFATPRARGIAVAEAAMEMARRCDDPDARADALVHGYRILQTGIGDDAARARIAEELEEVVERGPAGLVRQKACHTLVWESIIRGVGPGV
jgi:hypothetical protein